MGLFRNRFKPHMRQEKRMERYFTSGDKFLAPLLFGSVFLSACSALQLDRHCPQGQGPQGQHSQGQDPHGQGLPVVKQMLESHPMCGVVTGGQEECYFDCRVNSSLASEGQAVSNLQCLEDCFSNDPEDPSYCIASLLSDVLANGTCYTEGNSGLYPISQSCTGQFDYYDYEETGPLVAIDTGTCSPQTENLIVTDKCETAIRELPGLIKNTIKILIRDSCSNEAYGGNLYACSNRKRNKRDEMEGNDANHFRMKRAVNNSHARLSRSVAEVDDDGPCNYKTELEYENTRHRYPWICSLRSRGNSPEHLCAVNLLSVPPQPTIIVGVAHCTYLCKDSNEVERPACCCDKTGPSSCADDTEKCGNGPDLYEIGPGDVDIVCGEWDTSENDANEEKYNVVLSIDEIVRHPNFKPGKSVINGFDLAIFKINEENWNETIFKSNRIYPACLPPIKRKQENTGIHSGWSKPPPREFLMNYGPPYLKYYSDFFKQWHYKMDIMEQCKDPTKTQVFGADLLYPSNSPYPPGTICAKDFTRQSCFSTGASGSPLMAKEDMRSSRFYIEGLLSFVKGCDIFQMFEQNSVFNPTGNSYYTLTQLTENPSTYTKLSCYLPWIASQFDLCYGDKASDEACMNWAGDQTDVDKPKTEGVIPQDNICRTTPASLRGEERECIFPFYYQGKLYDQCILFEDQNFVFPIFRCPVYNVTTKINGTNSFPDFIKPGEGFCRNDDGDVDLNDTTSCCNYGFCNDVTPFAQCKNNCRGVTALGILAG